MEYCWILKLPDDSEHIYYTGPEENDPLTTISGFDQGDNYMIQCPCLVDESGVLSEYALPPESGDIPDWAEGAPNLYLIPKANIVGTSGIPTGL